MEQVNPEFLKPKQKYYENDKSDIISVAAGRKWIWRQLQGGAKGDNVGGFKNCHLVYQMMILMHLSVSK